MLRRRVIGSINISNVAIVTCESKTYNGQTQVATNITVTFKGETLTEGVDYIVTENNGGTNVDSYTVKIKGIKKYSGEAQGLFSIEKVTPTVTIPTPRTSLIYNGNAQALVNAGSTNWGTLQYSLDDSSYSTSVPSGTNATSYTVYYRVVGNSNINDVPAQSTGVTIAKADTTYVIPTANNRTYDTTSKDLLNAGSVTGGTIQYSTSQSGTYSTTIPSQTNAGTYATWWKIVGDSNHNDKSPASISTTVSPKTVSSPTITLSQDTYTYANTAFQPTPTVKDGSTTISSGEYTVSYSNNTNVGTATCTITDKSGGNYTVSGSKTFTITCYSATAPTAKNGNWTGSAQALANAGSTSYGTMVYCSTSGGTFATTIPTGTNAGSYEVWWKVTGNTNVCNTAATKVACTIKQVAMTYTAPKAATRNYSGSAQQIVSGQSATGGAIYFATSSAGASSSTTVPTQTNAGTYSTYWKAVPDSNHSGGTSSWAQVSNCVINKVAGSVTTAPVNNNYTYNGTARAVASAGSGTGTMYYRLGTSGSFSTTMPTMTNAGSNTLYYYAAESTNYTQSSTGSITVSVQKANISPTVSISNWTYGGTASNPSVAGNSGSGTVTYYYKLSSASSWSTTKPSNAGSYNIRADIATTTNYNSGTCTNNFTINKANSSLSFAVTDITVTPGNTVSNVVTVNAGDGTVTYASNNTSVVTVNNNGNVSGVGAGNTTVSANISSTNNYNSASASYNAVCIIPVITAKFNVTSTSSPTRIASGRSSLSKIEIDGVEQPSVTTGYTFSTTGEHTVKYYLTGLGIGNSAFTGCINMVSASIPNSVKSIGKCAFSGCTGATTITIGNGVTTIGDLAFRSCGITSIAIPDSVTSIGSSSFYYCTKLITCTIGSGVTSIGDNAFGYCMRLTGITIPDSVTNIGVSAFTLSSGMTSCSIGNGVTSIGAGVFGGCRSLTSCTIGNGVTSIGNSAFSGCSALTSVNIPSGVTSIGASAFTSCSNITGNLVIPNGMISIGDWAFYNCKKITGSIYLSNNVTSIGKHAFENCSGLTSVTIGSGVTSIGDGAFENCTGITSANVGSGSIGNSAFTSCSSMISLTLGSGVTSIGEFAINHCPNLTSITSESMVAPTVNMNSFYLFHEQSGVLYVPRGSNGYDTWMSSSPNYLGYYNWTKVER